jgi:hypothetical protein
VHTGVMQKHHDDAGKACMNVHSRQSAIRRPPVAKCLNPLPQNARSHRHVTQLHKQAAHGSILSQVVHPMRQPPLCISTLSKLLNLPHGLYVQFPSTAAANPFPVPPAGAAAAVAALACPACTGTVLGLALGSGCASGSVTVSTPLSRLALMLGSRRLAGRPTEREKETALLHASACGAGGGEQRQRTVCRYWLWARCLEAANLA